MFHEGAFHLKRPDAVAGALDDIVIAPYKPVIAVRVSPGGVARVVNAVFPGTGHRVGILPVFAEQTSRMLFIRILDADGTDDAVLTGISILIEQVDLVDRSRLAHRTGTDFHPREISEQDGGFGLAEALVNSQACLTLDLVEYLGIERLACKGGMFNEAEIVFCQILFD